MKITIKINNEDKEIEMTRLSWGEQKEWFKMHGMIENKENLELYMTWRDKLILKHCPTISAEILDDIDAIEVKKILEVLKNQALMQDDDETKKKK